MYKAIVRISVLRISEIIRVEIGSATTQSKNMFIDTLHYSSDT